MKQKIRAETEEQQKLIDLFHKEGQEHIFSSWSKLKKAEKDSLLKDMADIDFKLIKELTEKHIKKQTKEEKKKIEPAEFVSLPATKKEKRMRQKALTVGRKALSKSQVAAFLVAGGQGSRLGFEGPKGCFQISPVEKKSLFQMHAEKILSIQNKFKTIVPWYIMTSTANDEATKEFFAKNNYFGLHPKNIIFFIQNEIPAVDMNGKLIMESKYKIFKNPNGHGGSILALHESGAIKDMKKRGIKYIFYFQVDNVLVRMLDPVFIGHHILKNAEMSSKIVRKAYPEERVGVVGYVNGKLGVVEYSDLPKEEMFAKNEKGELKYIAGSIALHCISTAFVEKLNKKGFMLPYHRAVKKIPTFKGEIEGNKFETFVFDALGYAKSSVTLEVKREDEFAPVKNKDGPDSPQTAHDLQVEMYARWLEYCRINLPKDDNNKFKGKIEISPLFAIDPNELKKKLQADFKLNKNNIVSL
jgi:UDP-N-acetylglucosamine/UDP-N-acetylgalactosamine diphosphorylase